MTANATPSILPMLESVFTPEKDIAAPVSRRIVIVAGSERFAEKVLAHQSALKTRKYIVLPSSRHPRLLLPWDDSRKATSGLALYAPFSRSGRFLKWLANIAAHLQFAPSGSRIQVTSVGSLALEEMVANVTGVSDPYFAAYVGVGPLRRVVLQAMSPDGAILGYVKIPFEPESLAKIRHEGEVLTRLSLVESIAEHIPCVLFAGELDGTYALFQSALRGTPALPEYSPAMDRVLEKIRQAWACTKKGAFVAERSAATWSSVADLLGDGAMRLGEDAARLALRAFGDSDLECGLSHGDFAPWNMRVTGQHLGLFDWESSTFDSPLSWDRYHFHVQVRVCLGKRMGPLRFGSPQEIASFISYLVDSIPPLLDHHSRIDLAHRQRQMKNISYRLGLLQRLVRANAAVSQLDL